jgi:peptide-methionine (S)-S-oxide reductase
MSGVAHVQNGYAGGTKPNPTYKSTCDGSSDHAEVVQITYDAQKVAYSKLLSAFFLVHDPTQLNGQGNDIGPQYRSLIMWHDEEQRELAAQFIKKLNQDKFNGKIKTILQKYDMFYKGEAYHNDYYGKNPSEGYCRFVVAPKLAKFEKEMKDL